MKRDGLRGCSRKCMEKKVTCGERECKFYIEHPEDYNCCLVAIYEHGPMTLRQIGERLGISFARVKQIETIALRKMKANSLFS